MFVGFTYDIIIIVDTYDKVQRGISTIDDLVLPMIQKTALILRATKTFPYELSLQCDSLAVAKLIKVLG